MHLDTPIRTGNKYRYLHVKGEDILLALGYYRRGHFSVDAKLYIPVCRVRIHNYIEFLLKQTRPGPPFAWFIP